MVDDFISSVTVDTGSRIEELEDDDDVETEPGQVNTSSKQTKQPPVRFLNESGDELA